MTRHTAQLTQQCVRRLSDKKAEYTEALSGALSAAKRGYVDDIIEPDATRKRVIAAFDMLFSKSEDKPYKKHGTI